LISKIHRQEATASSHPPRRGTRGPGHSGQPRPGTDRPRPVLDAEGRLQDRQRTGRQQCSADSLERTSGDERPEVRRHGARQGGDAEPRRSDHEHPPPAEPIAQRPADEHKGGEGQRVGVDRPGETADAGAEIPTDGRQRDVDDGGFEEGDRRAEHGRGEDPPAGRFGVGESLRHPTTMPAVRHMTSVHEQGTSCASAAS
jgi:hypothetical protein